MRRNDLHALLVEHTEAWNRHDLDRLMGLFADDCAFEASAGPGPRGSVSTGREEVRAAFAEVLRSMPDAHWGDGRHAALSDDRGVSEWRLTGTRSDGTHLDVIGCDFLTFRGREIVLKSSFRKQPPAV